MDGGTSVANRGGGGGGINCGTSHLGTGGNANTNGSPGGGLGGSKAGNGGSSGGLGGNSGGGGGIGGTDGVTSIGGDGGYGGGGGGNGGFGGGGSGGSLPNIGGFGGGGGGGSSSGGGSGGFGGGGGGGSIFGDSGGIGGGVGGSAYGGGGAAGFGGAIFINSSGTLTIQDSFNTNSNSTAFGTNGGGTGSQGWNAGNDAFFLTGANINLNPNGNTIIFSESIADDSSASFVGAPVGVTKGTAVGAILNIGNIANAPGTAILQVVNTYSGGTNLKNGTLRIDNGNSLGSGAVTFVNPGTTLQAGGSFSTPNAILLNANGNIDSQGNTFTLTGGITGAGLMTKLGTGILALSGSNTYGGGTTISAGTLRIDTTSSLPANTNMTLSGSGATLNLNTVASSFTIGDLSGVTGTIVSLSSNHLTFGTSNSTTFAGSMTGIGSVTKQGSGTVIFSGASTYSGPTLINAGTFVING